MRIEPSDSIVATVVAAGQVISDRPCIVQGVILNPAAASCTVALYDPAVGVTSTTGATLKISMSGAAAGSSPTASISASGVAFQNGCVAVVAGAGATATVIFAKI